MVFSIMRLLGVHYFVPELLRTPLMSYQRVNFINPVGARPIAEISNGFFESAMNYTNFVSPGQLLFFSYANTASGWESNVLAFANYRYVTDFDDREPVYIVTPSSMSDFFPDANVILDNTFKSVYLVDLPSSVSIVRPLL